MGWIETYAQLVKALTAKNGSWTSAVPKMKTSDMVALLGMYTTGVVPAVERVADAIIPSNYATAEGESLVAGVGGAFTLMGLDAPKIDARTYVSKTVGLDGAPWKRYLSAGASIDKSTTYEPVRDPSLLRDNQLEQIGFVRQLMADYQRALDASAAALATYNLGFANQDRCAVFLSSIRSTGADLDVLAENPPTSLSDDLAGALRAATDKSEAALVSVGNAVGKAAAEIGNVAGQVAGSFGAGFFTKAGVLTLAVAGVAAWVAFH